MNFYLLFTYGTAFKAPSLMPGVPLQLNFLLSFSLSKAKSLALMWLSKSQSPAHIEEQ